MHSFSDRRVYVVPHNSPNLAQVLSDKDCGYEQGEDGPVYIHVGTALADNELRRVWEQRKRFMALTLEELKAIRDRDATILQLA